MRHIEHAVARACASIPRLPASRQTTADDNPAKTSTYRAAAFAAGLVIGMLSGFADATPISGRDTVQQLYDALLITMEHGHTLGRGGRFAQLETVIHRTFDIPVMVRLSIGPSWASLTEQQRQQLIESFARYISAIYANRFDSYAGQKLQVTGEESVAAGVIVHSQANSEPVKVNYMMRQAGDDWLISGIYLDGAITEVATRRSEFGAVIRTGGSTG